MLSASAIRRLVSPAMAEGTTTRSWPAAFHFATRRATFLIRSIEPTEVPPNFWTMSAMKSRAFYRIDFLLRHETPACDPAARRGLVHGAGAARTLSARHDFSSAAGRSGGAAPFSEPTRRQARWRRFQCGVPRRGPRLWPAALE